jgi:hypothetical protein
MPSEWCDMPFSTGVATEILLLPVSPHVPCSFLSHPSSVLFLYDHVHVSSESW